MKKLLSVINFYCIVIMMFSCRNTQPAKFQGSASETAINDTVMVQDTSKSIMHTAPQGSASESPGMNKDSLKAPVKSTAIIHTAPDQAKIDSIKNAKQKIKK